ncbi:replication protein B [Klebsiella pneumoniae]|uniref:replication protein B n=1 Tax=Klebsiella pneumoniae TaxID=573 RepID=UPI003B9EF4F7
MTVMTLNLVEKQPAAMRRIIGKHLAVPRWQDTCDYYNQMMERERLTVCFHAQLKQRHATMRFEEMNDVERERLVCAIDELRGAFSKRRQVGASEYAYISFLTVSQRRTLFMHAGLTEKEFNQPYWRIKEGANKQVISSQADSLIKISRIWADFFPANTSNQPI